MRARYVLIFLVLWVETVSGQTRIDVNYLGERKYNFFLQFSVPASREVVYALLTDYNHLHRLNQSIKSSELVRQIAPDTTRVKMFAEACVLVFCKEVTLVEDVKIVEPATQLRSEAVPFLSDVESAQTVWRIEAQENGTQITCESAVQFKFWAPPLIGPLAIRHALRKNVKQTIESIKQLTSTEFSPP